MSNKLAGSLIIILISAGVGFFIGQNKIPQSAQSPQTCEHTAGLLDLPEKEIEEYLLLKDQKAKFEKADELLGKMILIFLADLENKTDRQKQLEEKIKNNGTLSTDPLTAEECLVAPAKVETSPIVTESAAATVTSSLNPQSTSKPISSSTSSVPPAEAEDSEPQLSEVEFFYRFATDNPVTEEQFQLLNRTWQGYLRFPRERDYAIRLDFLSRQDSENKISGAIMLKLTPEDKVLPWNEIIKRSKPIKGPIPKNKMGLSTLFFAEDSQTVLQILHGPTRSKGFGYLYYKNSNGTYSELGSIQVNRYIRRTLQN